MARSRSTAGKMRREEEKRTRAKAKQDKRLARRDEEPVEAGPARKSEDQTDILNQLAELHQELADGQISLETFETKQEELRSRLQVD